MSSLFAQTTPSSDSLIEATVLSVDVKRYVCTVKTVKGQRYNNVTWLIPAGGQGRDTTSFNPKLGDKVVISSDLGYPVIMGCLPRPDRNPISNVDIDSGSSIADPGRLGPSSGSSLNPGKPEDMVAGDKIITSDGGGLIAALRSGTILLKSSKLAQIILSKLDDGVKIVGRSIDVHAEVGSDVYASIKGRVYRWVGLARTPSESRSGLFRYQEFYGDTLTAEALKDNYELGAVGGLPAGGGSLKKVLVVDANQIPLRIEEVDLEGNVTTTTRSADGVATNVVGYTNGNWELTVTNGVYAKIKVVPGEVFITYNNDPTVKLDTLGIHLHKGTCDVKVLQDSILMGNGTHFVNITPAGVQMG